ncbi:MAG: T9SS type A sorting domain-containing protein, partial [Bacteroidales bacterium]|nr:T9SS type A sorting domain-containing protein [Bacteroidales bacterium]
LKPKSIHKKPEITLSNKSFDGSDDREERAFVGFNIYRNNGIIEELYTETEYHDTLTQAGEYTYFVKAIYDQCMSDSSNNVTISLYVNIENNEISDKIKIYPNPTNDHLIIELNTEAAENMKVKIFDINGCVVESIMLNPSTVKNTINLSNLNSGVYFINVSNKEFQRTEKLLVF